MSCPGTQAHVTARPGFEPSGRASGSLTTTPRRLIWRRTEIEFVWHGQHLCHILCVWKNVNQTVYIYCPNVAAIVTIPLLVCSSPFSASSYSPSELVSSPSAIFSRRFPVPAAVDLMPRRSPVLEPAYVTANDNKYSVGGPHTVLIYKLLQ